MRRVGILFTLMILGSYSANAEILEVCGKVHELDLSEFRADIKIVNRQALINKTLSVDLLYYSKDSVQDRYIGILSDAFMFEKNVCVKYLVDDYYKKTRALAGVKLTKEDTSRNREIATKSGSILQFK